MGCPRRSTDTCDGWSGRPSEEGRSDVSTDPSPPDERADTSRVVSGMGADPDSIRVGRYQGELYRADAERRVVLLPGVGYTVQGPLLWFAREVAVARGYGVLAITETARQSTDPFAWTQDAARAALAYRPVERCVVIGKSLASVAAPVASEEAVPALWLTPLLNQSVVAQNLDRSAAAVWLVGSDGDPNAGPRACTGSRLTSSRVHRAGPLAPGSG